MQKGELMEVIPIQEFRKEVSYPEKIEAAQISMIKSCVSFAGNKRELTQDEYLNIWYQINLRKLDPIARQIYFICDKQGKINTFNSIDGMRLTAQRTGEYAGQDGPYFLGKDGVWLDHWVSQEYPLSAKVGVLRKGFLKPIYSVANWKEYNKGNHIWNKYPTVMLAKAAESLALRRAFPEELSGVYSDAESWIEENREEEKLVPQKIECEVKNDEKFEKLKQDARELFSLLPQQENKNMREKYPSVFNFTADYETFEKFYKEISDICDQLKKN